MRRVKSMIAGYFLTMLIFSYYFEYIVGLSPCILCEIQRYILIPLLLFSVALLYFNGVFGAILRVLRQLILVFCLFLGWHHISLINHPSNSVVDDSCLPDIFTILKYQGFSQAWTQVLRGGPSCHKITWQLFSLSLPELTFIAYAVIFVICYIEFFISRKSCKK